jgi:hypothetical protein
MNRHFQNYAALPSEALGSPIRKEAEKPSPETPWKPVQGHPGYLGRINAQGVREVTHKDNVPAPVQPAAASELWDVFAHANAVVQSLGGRPVYSSNGAIDRVLAAPAAPAPAVDVPEGATHRNSQNGLFYRAANDALEFWDLPRCCWCLSSCHSSALTFEIFQPLLQSTAPTEWQSGPPPEVGWYYTQDDYDRGHQLERLVRFWGGSSWSVSTAYNHDAGVKSEIACIPADEREFMGINIDIRWRGPRLTGADWPEPQQ